jgi:hypothetical protein
MGSKEQYLRQFYNRDNSERLRQHLREKNIDFDDFKNSIKIVSNDKDTILAKSKYIATELGGLRFTIVPNDDYINDTIINDNELRAKISFKPFLCMIIMVETGNLFQRLGIANRMFKLLFEKFEKDCHFCLEIEAFALVSFDIVEKFYEKLGFVNYDFFISADYRWKI